MAAKEKEADPFSLDGALALVTGASRGLGRAIALERRPAGDPHVP